MGVVAGRPEPEFEEQAEAMLVRLRSSGYHLSLRGRREVSVRGRREVTENVWCLGRRSYGLGSSLSRIVIIRKSLAYKNKCKPSPCVA
jgi:hypothetical protein